MVLHSTFITLCVWGGWWWYELSHFSCVQLFLIPQTVAHQALLSMMFSRQEYGCHALLQEIFPTQGLNPASPALQADSLPLITGKPCITMYILSIYLCTYLLVPLPALECQFPQDKISVCFVHGYILATWKSAWHIIGAQ